MKTFLHAFLVTCCLFLYSKSSAQMSFMTSTDYGQVFDVTYDPQKPNVLYAHTVTNHIVRSPDNGASWEIAYSFPLNLSFAILKDLRWTQDKKFLSFIVKAEGSVHNQVIIFDPATETVIKSFASPNGNRSSNLIASYSVTGPNHENVLLHTTYMGSNFGLVTEIFYSRTGGSQWNQIYASADHDGVHANNVAIFPTDPEKIFIARGESPGSKIGGLFFSNDSGSTWTEKIPGNTYSEITFDPTDDQKIFLGTWYGSGAHVENLYTSDDGGDTWRIIPITWTASTANSINKIVINPFNTEHIIVLEANEIVISNDGGENWTNYVYPTNDVENKYYYGLNATFNSGNSQEVIISSNYYPFRSLDGGITLSRFKTPFANNTSRVSLHNKTEKHLYYGLRGGFIHHDFESGSVTGTGLQPLGTYSAITNNGLFTDPEVAGRVYVSNTRSTGMSNFLVSTNHGSTFTPVYSNFLLNIYKIQTAKQNTANTWVSFGTMLRKFNFSTPGSVTSEEVLLPEEGIVNAISIDENNENRVIISLNTKVYKTEDGGQTWNPSSAGLEGLSGGADIIYDVTKNPFNKDEFLLACTRGIFLSADAGNTWQQIYSGNAINSAEFSPHVNGTIVAYSQYRDTGSDYTPSQAGIVYSTNRGQNWTEADAEELHYLFSESSVIDFSAENKVDVYFSTLDLGLVKYEINLQTLNTGKNDLSKSLLQIYPNPASDYIMIANDRVKEVSVYDLSGKAVLKVINQTEINIARLPAGVYIVQAVLSTGKSVSKRMIKK